jgi:hypothetical protein
MKRAQEPAKPRLSLHELYRGQITVWVEDEITREFLTILWALPKVSVWVGHSKDGVKHLVDSVPQAYKHLVLGFVDCDFDLCNEMVWDDPSTKIFRPPCHELENFLLDFDILATLSQEVDAATIQQRAEASARELHWWMSGKKTLRQIRQTLNTGFPDEPRPFSDAAKTLPGIVSHILQNAFPTAQVAALSQWNQNSISALVQQSYNEFGNDLASGQWKNSFSGKEVFRALRNQIKGLPKSDTDLAIQIARKMKETNQCPATISRLREILRAKITSL